MAFETRPFNLGNTLAQAAQIQGLRKRNTLADLQIGQIEARNRNQNALSEALTSGADVNQLARMPGGSSLAETLQSLDERQFAMVVQRGQMLNRAANMVANSKNPKQSAQFVASDPQMAEILGSLDVSDMDPEEVRSAAAQLAAESAIFTDPQKVAQLQRGSSLPIQTEQGAAFATETFNPRTGESGVNITPIPGTLTNRSGETPEQLATRQVETTRRKEASKKAEQRKAELVEVGQRQADSTAILRRGLQLLEIVDTGRPEEIKLAAQNLFGIAGADETELNTNLGKAILSQLREVFGAQFTEREGQRLEFIEANFGKSTEGNRRLLQQALRLAERDARRGIEAAGEGFDAEEIRKALEFDLTPPSDDAPQTQEPTATGPNGEKAVLRDGKWVIL